jgi:hypothetical protein
MKAMLQKLTKEKAEMNLIEMNQRVDLLETTID